MKAEDIVMEDQWSVMCGIHIIMENAQNTQNWHFCVLSMGVDVTNTYN